MSAVMQFSSRYALPTGSWPPWQVFISTHNPNIPPWVGYTYAIMNQNNQSIYDNCYKVDSLCGLLIARSCK